MLILGPLGCECVSLFLYHPVLTFLLVKRFHMEMFCVLLFRIVELNRSSLVVFFVRRRDHGGKQHFIREWSGKSDNRTSR